MTGEAVSVIATVQQHVAMVVTSVKVNLPKANQMLLF